MIGGSAAEQPCGSPRAGTGPRRARRSMREIDHHDAVLLDDADQQDDADQRDHAEVEAERASASASAPSAGRGQRREDRERVDVALVEHAEDRCRRRREPRAMSSGSLASEVLEGLRVALEGAERARPALPSSRSALLDRPRPPGRARRPGARLKRERHRRELALVVDRRVARSGASSSLAKVVSGTCCPLSGDLHVDLVERCRVALRARAGPPGSRGSC